MSIETAINEAIVSMIEWREELRKKRGRPIPEGGRRDQTLKVRMNEEEKKELETLSERFAMSPSDIVRALIRNKYMSSSDVD